MTRECEICNGHGEITVGEFDDERVVACLCQQKDEVDDYREQLAAY